MTFNQLMNRILILFACCCLLKKVLAKIKNKFYERIFSIKATDIVNRKYQLSSDYLSESN